MPMIRNKARTHRRSEKWSHRTCWEQKTPMRRKFASLPTDFGRSVDVQPILLKPILLKKIGWVRCGRWRLAAGPGNKIGRPGHLTSTECTSTSDAQL